MLILTVLCISVSTQDRNLNGQYHGEGTLIYADGSKYVGAFHEGKRGGNGMYTDPKGDWTSAIWADGEIKEELERGKKGQAPRF
jgi:hypothetical protein